MGECLHVINKQQQHRIHEIHFCVFIISMASTCVYLYHCPGYMSQDAKADIVSCLVLSYTIRVIFSKNAEKLIDIKLQQVNSMI